MCALGVTITSIALIQLYGINEKIGSITSISLNDKNESNVIILKAKIVSLESTLKAKEEVYHHVIEQNLNSLIIACILFNLLFITILSITYFNQRKK